MLRKQKASLLFRSSSHIRDGFSAWRALSLCVLLIFAPSGCRAQKVSNRNCLLWLPVCRAHHDVAMADEWKDENQWAYEHLGVGEIAESCLSRARSWHDYCQNAIAEPVQAMFVPTEQTATFPDPTTQIEADQRCQSTRCEQQEAESGQAHETAQFGPSAQRVALVITGQSFSRDDCRGIHNSNVWAREHADGALSDIDERRMEAAFRDSVEKHGGSLASFVIGHHWKIDQDIGKYRFSQWEGDKCARLQQYVGWYRVWQSVQAHELSTRTFFDALVLHRSDGFFIRDMAPIHDFPAGAVSVKDCLSWFGVNDKAFVVPRAFASLWMEVIVFIYIDHGSLPAWFNAEQMLSLFAASKQIPLSRRSPAELPVLDFREFSFEWSDAEGVLTQRGGCFAQVYASAECVPEADQQFVLSRLCTRR